MQKLSNKEKRRVENADLVGALAEQVENLADLGPSESHDRGLVIVCSNL